MEETHSKSLDHSPPACILVGLVIALLSVILSIDLVDSRLALIVVALMIASVLGYFVYHNKKIWVPILICLLLVRDFNLGGLISEGSIKIGDLFIAYLFVIWWIDKKANGRSALFARSNFDVFIGLFILIHLLSLLWSIDIEYGLLRFMKLVRNFMFYIIIRESFIADFTGTYKKATASYILTGILLMTVYTSVVLSVGGLADFISLSQKETLSSLDLGALRARGTGGGFLISGPAMWFFITATLIFGSLAMKNKRLVCTLKISLIIMFALGALLTLQRSLLVMVTVMLLFLLAGSLYIRSRKSVIYISIIIVAFVFIGSTFKFADIFEKRFEKAFDDGSWTERVELYTAAIDAFRQNPLLGIGAGSNYSWRGKYEEIVENRTRIVHSAYLLVLSEVGLIGFGIFMIVIYFWMKYLFDGFRNTNRMPSMRNICMALFAFSASYLVYIAQVGEFEEFEVWFVMAIAAAIKNLDLKSIETEKRLSCAGAN